MAVRARRLQPEKVAAVESLTRDLGEASSYIFTEYRGLTVEQLTALRRALREFSCVYRVVRNNFANIAFTSLNMTVGEYLVGPTAIALVDTEHANGVARVLFDFAKEVPALVVKGAILDGEVFDASKVEAYSKLPGKKELISMFLSALNATTVKFVRVLQAVMDKRDEGVEVSVVSGGDSS